MEKYCSACSETATIPFSAHESDMSRCERSNRRLWILVIILVSALVLTNLAWVIHENQYEDVDIERYIVTQDASGNGDNNSIIGLGDIYGETEDNLRED